MCFLCPAPSAASSSPWQARRAFVLAAAAGAAAPALAQVEVGSASGMRRLVPAETLESSATQQYSQLLAQARAQGALVPSGHPQLARLSPVRDDPVGIEEKGLRMRNDPGRRGLVVEMLAG